MKRIVQLGFTLIELMVTLVILSILVAIAYPSYMHWTMVTRRSDAQIALTQLAAEEEKFFTNCNWYTNNFSNSGGPGCGTNPATPGNLPVPNVSPDGYYNLSITANPKTTGSLATSYLLLATPVNPGPQASDSECTSFTLDETGKQGSTGTATDCWKR